MKVGDYVRFDYHRVSTPIQIAKITETHYDNEDEEIDWYAKHLYGLYNQASRLREENNHYMSKIDKQKEVLDKIKEYCNHKLEMLELQKRNIMQILTPENGYLKTDIEIEMQKYKDILELLEEIE